MYNKIEENKERECLTMASLMDKKVVKDDKKFLIGLISTFLFVLWLCSPFGNRFAQIAFWADNCSYLYAKFMNTGRVPDYVHYRNRAIYLAKIYPKDSKRSLNEMNKAVELGSKYLDDNAMSKLYSDRAQIKLYYGDKKGALQDFLTADHLSITDDLKAAVLLTDNGQYVMASEYCKDILAERSGAFAGYACLSYVYEAAGRPDTAIKLYDLAIDRKPNSAIAYMERARLKQRLNNIDGYNQDKETAKKLSPNIEKEMSIIEEAVAPGKLSITITS